MAAKLGFFQIYYDDDQLEYLYPFATPVKNDSLTHYFENTVIASMVPFVDADRISICSWRLARKRGDVRRHTKGELTEESIINNDYDVAILTPRAPSHMPLAMAAIWHRGVWDIAIKKLHEFINVPNELKRAIYENHFVANGNLYKEYVRTCLIPCIDFMEHNKDIFLLDANYRTKKTKEEQRAYKEMTGRDDWPIAPFVLERLFSIWINDKDLKVISL